MVSNFKLDIELDEVANLTVNTGFTRAVPLKTKAAPVSGFFMLFICCTGPLTAG